MSRQMSKIVVELVSMPIVFLGLMGLLAYTLTSNEENSNEEKAMS